MKNSNIIGFICETTKPFRLLILAQLFVAIFWAIDLSVRPYILKIIIDRIPNIRPEMAVDGLWWPIVFYLAMSFTLTLAFRIFDYTWIKLNSPLKCHLGDVLMKKMMNHSLTMFQDQFAGNLANKIKEVMSGIPDLIRLGINQFFSQALALVIAIIAVSTINYKFGILLGVWILVFICCVTFFLRPAKILCDKAAKVRSVVVGQMVDMLSNIISIHLFTNKRDESKSLDTHLEQYMLADQARDYWFLWMFFIQGASFVIYQAVCFAFLVSGFKDGSVTVGDFALLISVNIEIISFLWELSKNITVFSELIGNVKQGLIIALTPVDIVDKQGAKTLEVGHGRIVYDQVKFSYKNTEPLFQNKSITIDSGQKIGLVGYSGGGKTTFANLILRLYDINDGRILIDDQDISCVTLDSLRQNIGMIPQDPSLFHRSLMENIRYGRIDATDDEVVEAAKQAYAHDFITKLPQGYASPVGERGIKLSGGQRQRIAIARAILKNAPILILDEATSQLDSVTENYIQESLAELMRGKTTIVIAHRLSTLLHMDRILVFDKGRIIEDGAHQKLLTKNGVYARLWNAQVGGFLPDGSVRLGDDL